MRIIFFKCNTSSVLLVMYLNSFVWTCKQIMNYKREYIKKIYILQVWFTLKCRKNKLNNNKNNKNYLNVIILYALYIYYGISLKATQTKHRFAKIWGSYSLNALPILLYQSVIIGWTQLFHIKEEATHQSKHSDPCNR